MKAKQAGNVRACSSSRPRRLRSAAQSPLGAPALPLLVLVLLALVMGATREAHADPFAPPTAEELSMTSLPGYPGAAAVVLYREEITKDDLHVVQHYERIKILNEDGKKYANVQLNYVSTYGEGLATIGDDKTVGDIVGRTIHADGTIIPFTGKPYKKMMEQIQGVKLQAMVFTLPDVQVGSIIEYRYATRINDRVYESPAWFIQRDLFLKSGHFMWYPTTRDLIDDHERPINSISWFPILPAGVHIDHQTLPAPNGFTVPTQIYEVKIKDVPPTLTEDHMPPIESFSYRVMFNFTAFRSGDDYWKSEGRDWSKRQESFTNPNQELRSATQTVIAGATSDEDKLRRIYAAVEELDNTAFTREHEQREDKAEGDGKLKTAADVLSRKRGDPSQLTELFVGMARVAGFKAYLMLVPDRSKTLFTPSWLSFEQFGGTIAIVNVGGKEMFFDPGSRYCPYGRLAWEHTLVEGLRQTDDGAVFAKVEGDSYKANHTTRVANLTMDPSGAMTGKIVLTFEGAPALEWRQIALRGDDESLHRDLQEHLEAIAPKSLELKVVDIQNLRDYEKPLLVTYQVKGGLGTPVGKRLVMPAELFVAGSPATFPHDKRQNAVDFHYPSSVQDALRINLPPDVTIEAVPAPGTYSIPQRASYDLNVVAAPANFTTRRNYAMGDMLFMPNEYPQLKTFYSQLESKDQETVVLKTTAAQTTANSTPAN